MGYIAEPIIAGWFTPLLAALSVPVAAAHAIAVGVALLLANLISMLFGELVPQYLAIARPLPTARAVAGAQAGFSAVLGWFITLLNAWANWLVRRLGVEPVDELASARSPQELGSLVRTSAERGTLDPGTANLLNRSLRFGERTAGELMTPRVQVESLPTDAVVADLVELTRRTGFSRFPVCEGDLDDVRGVVHVKQAFSIRAAKRADTPVSSIMLPAQIVPESLDGDTLLDRLRSSGLQLAIVVDEYGGTAGLVTLEDLVEEIVGDVRDEHDRAEINPVRPLGRDSWMVSGLLRDDELADATGFRMPDGDYETLAGLVLSRLGRIPEVNDEVRIDGWRITVMRMDRHRVAELRVAKLPESLSDNNEAVMPR
jgi:CBS domain containing-hemolysin-like protein